MLNYLSNLLSSVCQHKDGKWLNVLHLELTQLHCSSDLNTSEFGREGMGMLTVVWAFVHLMWSFRWLMWKLVMCFMILLHLTNEQLIACGHLRSQWTMVDQIPRGSMSILALWPNWIQLKKVLLFFSFHFLSNFLFWVSLTYFLCPHF
jgi:hypothetical protein